MMEGAPGAHPERGGRVGFVLLERHPCQGEERVFRVPKQGGESCRTD